MNTRGFNPNWMCRKRCPEHNLICTVYIPNVEHLAQRGFKVAPQPPHEIHICGAYDPDVKMHAWYDHDSPKPLASA